LSGPKLAATLDKKSWQINAQTFSPDGKYLATAGDGDSVHIFETATWNEVFHAEYGQPYSFHELVFSADSKRLAGVDAKLHVWDVESHSELYEIGGPPFDPITAIATSPDGQRLAVARLNLPYGSWHAEPGAAIELWPLGAGSPELLPKKTYELDEIRFSPDSRILAAAGQQTVTESRYTNVIEGDLLLWNLAENRELEVKARQGTTVAAFSPSVSFSADGKQLVAGALVDITPARECPNGDSSYVACGENEFLKYARLLLVIEPATGITTKELRAGRGNALLLAQSPDGQHVISANEKTLRLWDLSTPKLDQTFEPQLAPADQMAPADYWSSIRQPKFGGDYENPVADALAYFPDGRSIVVAQDNGFLLVLDALTGVQRKQNFAESMITSLALSGDGKSLATAHVRTPPRLWDPKTLISRPLEMAGEDCVSIAFAADGRTVVCGGTGGVILLWDAMSGEIIGRALRTPAGSWLVISAEGLFDGTTDGEQLVAWRLGNRTFTLNQLPESFHHRALLQDLFAGKRPQPKEDLASALNALEKRE